MDMDFNVDSFEGLAPEAVLGSCVPPSAEVLLHRVLDRVEEVAEPDRGLGICVLGPLSSAPEIAATAVKGPVEARFPGLVKSWIDKVANENGVEREMRAPSRSRPPAIGGMGSSLWVPLLEGRGTVAGVIYLESSRGDWATDSRISRVERVATASLPAILRTILRERMHRAGASLDIVGASPAFLHLERTTRLIARYDHGPVLITGERGAGKELTAWAIHAWSRRWKKPFVPVLMSALSDDLCADELLGHERSSFTGAAAHREGKFQAADGGTLFLDEVGDLTPKVQSALLRILETGELSRIGRDMPLRVDVRVVAATNLDLGRLVSEERFRRDLLDRLRIFEIRVPPLRERPEDIPFLVNHFLKAFCADIARPSTLLPVIACPECPALSPLPCATPAFYEALEAYSWPGNVRELHHVVLRLLATVPEEVLDVRHLPRQIREPARQARAEPRDPADRGDLSLKAAIRTHIERVLRMTGYNQTQAARHLGLPLSTLRSKIKKLEIDVS